MLIGIEGVPEESNEGCLINRVPRLQKRVEKTISKLYTIDLLVYNPADATSVLKRSIELFRKERGWGDDKIQRGSQGGRFSGPRA